MSESNNVAPTGLSASESFSWPAGAFDGVIMAFTAKCVAAEWTLCVDGKVRVCP